MDQLREAWVAVRFGGPMVYPLLAVGVLTMAIIIDRAAVYLRSVRLPTSFLRLVDTHNFDWGDFERELKALGTKSGLAQFFRVIAHNRAKPIWWLESRADEEAGRIEKLLGRGLWLLETVVTAAPLLGLLGTITGMIQAFKIIGGAGLVAPTKVTAGVAEALIATALGLLIAVIALFAFNFFARLQSQVLDGLEGLGSKLLDHIRLDQEHGGAMGHEAA